MKRRLRKPIFAVGNWAADHGYLTRTREWYVWLPNRRGLKWLATLCNIAGDW